MNGVTFAIRTSVFLPTRKYLDGYLVQHVVKEMSFVSGS